ncbi:uncharacterized protein LOC142632765 [Castanea sativa]|uniref:uncharacterized protein LOC142632765 n=1 Tax=Castanea sativa TaxID=21020 RepID=UPI003F64950C
MGSEGESKGAETWHLENGERRLLWDNLSIVARLHNLPWVIAGNFNEVLIGGDKFGGRPVNISQAIRFLECLDICKMIDIRFSGARYTWSNNRPFLSACPVEDRPVFCQCGLARPFRFQPMWLSHSSFSDIVQDAWTNTSSLSHVVSRFIDKAKVWNRDVFGNLFRRKKRTLARLRGAQIAFSNNPNIFLSRLEQELCTELVEVSKLEEEFWAMKLHITWLVEGDRNTGFYHTSALVRHSRNRINGLKDNMGN